MTFWISFDQPVFFIHNIVTESQSSAQFEEPSVQVDEGIIL